MYFFPFEIVEKSVPSFKSRWCNLCVLQKYAATMGSDTKCARCNVSDDAFHKKLNKQGIYISVRFVSNHKNYLDTY